MKAKAIISTDVRKMEVQAIEINSLEEWDIMVELEASAISVGTESYVLSSDRYPRPYIPGYSPIGRIVAIGTKAAELYNIGERVTYFRPNKPVDILQNCGGHQSPAMLNVNPERLHKSNLYCEKVPAGLSSERAAFGGISSICCLGVSMARQNVGDRALVVGQGMIGQLAAQHLKLRGAEVAVADLYEKRLLLSKQSGADHIINSGETDMVEAVRALWPDGADIIVDTTGNHKVVEKASDAIKSKGKFVMLGWVKGSEFTMEKFHHFRVFEAFFPWGLEGPRIASTWRLMETEAFKIDHLITHRFEIEEAQAAYDLIFDAPQDYVGIVFNWKG